MEAAQCANCGAVLTGPFCAACGQHAHDSARSVRALFHDAWHVITHVDSRFWRTMYTLLLRPGKLTQEYFAERRARYLPPVRVYLVVSVLFFAFGSASPHRVFEPGRSAATNPGGSERDSPKNTAALSVRSAAESASADATLEGPNFEIDAKDCDRLKISVAWLENPLRQACRRNVASHGGQLRDAFASNMPKMMFVFLPMMALGMLLLYWWPRRYYVEHLVFFLHLHAAMFLILLFERPISWAVAALPAVRPLGTLVTLAVSLYALWYVYRAMRVYYGQSRWPTLGKLALVALEYLIFLSITLVATLAVSALTA